MPSSSVDPEAPEAPDNPSNGKDAVPPEEEPVNPYYFRTGASIV